MSVDIDVNNNFNSAEDKMQYALGTMKAYSIHIYRAGGGQSCPGIIAATHAEALDKYLKHCPIRTSRNFSLDVVLCE